MKRLYLLSLIVMVFSVSAFSQVQYLKTTSGKTFPYGKIKLTTTTSATPAVVDTLPITNNTAGIIEVTVSGSTSAGVGATGKLIYRYTKAAGTLTIATADTASAVTVDGGISGAGFELAATSYNNAKLTITGKASTTIYWRSVITPYGNR